MYSRACRAESIFVRGSGFQPTRHVFLHDVPSKLTSVELTVSSASPSCREIREGVLQCSVMHGSGSEKGSFGKRVFPGEPVHFLEILENLENLEILESQADCGKQRRTLPFSRDSREFRDFRDSRDSSSEKTPFVMTLFPVPNGSGMASGL